MKYNYKIIMCLLLVHVCKMYATPAVEAVHPDAVGAHPLGEKNASEIKAFDAAREQQSHSPTSSGIAKNQQAQAPAKPDKAGKEQLKTKTDDTLKTANDKGLNLLGIAPDSTPTTLDVGTENAAAKDAISGKKSNEVNSSPGIELTDMNKPAEKAPAQDSRLADKQIADSNKNSDQIDSSTSASWAQNIVDVITMKLTGKITKSVTDKNGVTTIKTLNKDGSTSVTIKQPDKSSVTTVTSKEGNVTDIITKDRTGKIIEKSFTNDTESKPTTIQTTHPDGTVIKADISSPPASTTETYYPKNSKINYSITFVDGQGRTTTNSFLKDNSRLEEEKRADGSTTKNEYTGNQTIAGSMLQTKTYKLKSSTETTPDPANPGKNTIVTTKYNSQGKEISTETTNSDGSKSYTTTTYDKNGKPTTVNGRRSNSQRINNKVANAFAISGNKKITTTDPITKNTTVTTTDKNGNVLATKTTNEQGQVIETFDTNPVTKITKRVQYTDPSGKDQSSITTINKPEDPNSPITEIRGSDGKLTEVKDKDGNLIEAKDKDGNLIATKTTITALEKLVNDAKKPNDIFAEDVSTATYQAAKQLMTALMKSDKLTTNTTNLSLKALNAPEEDVNAAARTTRDFEKASRTTIHSKYNELTSTIAAAKRLGKPVDQEQFINDLIQQQIDNHLGKDAKSFQSKFVLSDGQNKVITDMILADEKYKPLFLDPSNPDYDKTTSIERLNLLAEMGDIGINAMSEGIAEFHTSFDADGTCTSTTTSKNVDGSKITLSSSFDNDGNPTKNSIDIDGTTYTTTYGDGWLYGKNPMVKKTQQNGTDVKEGTPLASKDGEFLSQAWILNKSIQSFKLASKIVLSAPKQGVINGIGMMIPKIVQGIAVAVFVPVVKITSMIPVVHVKDAEGKPVQIKDEQGNPVFEKDRYGNYKLDAKGAPIPKLEVNKFISDYQLTGHAFTDPALLVTSLKLADLAIGDNGQAFSSRAVAKAADAVGVKGMDGPLLATGKGSPVFNPDTPMAKGLAKLQGKTPEQAAQEAADLEASYATMIDPIIAAVQAPLKYFYKQSIGDRILSKSDLASSTTSNSSGVASKVADTPLNSSSRRSGSGSFDGGLSNLSLFDLFILMQ